MKKTVSLIGVFVFVMLLLPQTGTAEETEIQVIVQKANIRAKGDLSSEIVSQVSIGTVLKSDLKEGNWFRVILPPDEKGEKRTAYIHSSMVEVITPVKAEQQVQPVKTEPPALEKKPEKEKPQPEVKKEQPQKEALPLQTEQPRVPQGRGMEFGLRLSGGGSFFLFGRNDINSYLQGSDDMFNDMFAVSPVPGFSWEYNKIKPGIFFGGEFFFNFIPEIGIGLGVGMIRAGGKENGWTYEESGNSMEYEFTPRISAIPILVTAYFGIPIGKFMDIVAHAGGGIYLGTAQLNETLYMSDTGDWIQQERTWKAKSNAFGFHGGMAFAFHLSRFMDFVLDISGRSVNFSGLTADSDWTLTSNVVPEEAGTDSDLTLWFFEEETAGTWYPQVELNDTEPSSASMRDVEEAVVGLSGLYLQLGIKLKFNRLFMR